MEQAIFSSTRTTNNIIASAWALLTFLGLCTSGVLLYYTTGFFSLFLLSASSLAIGLTGFGLVFVILSLAVFFIARSVLYKRSIFLSGDKLFQGSKSYITNIKKASQVLKSGQCPDDLKVHFEAAKTEDAIALADALASGQCPEKLDIKLYTHERISEEGIIAILNALASIKHLRSSRVYINNDGFTIRT